MPQTWWLSFITGRCPRHNDAWQAAYRLGGPLALLAGIFWLSLFSWSPVPIGSWQAISALLPGKVSVLSQALVLNLRLPRSLVAILLGVALTALYASITDYLMLSHPLEINQALMWLTGSLWGRGWAFVYVALPWLLLLLPLSLLLCRPLDLLALGEEQATTLGINVRHAQQLILLLVLAAISVALCGPLSFIGLLGPHLTRRLVGHCCYCWPIYWRVPCTFRWYCPLASLRRS